MLQNKKRLQHVLVAILRARPWSSAVNGELKQWLSYRRGRQDDVRSGRRAWPERLPPRLVYNACTAGGTLDYSLCAVTFVAI